MQRCSWISQTAIPPETVRTPKEQALKKQKIFLVMAYVAYEETAPVRAFLTKADAEAFSAKCMAYNEKVPRRPAIIEDTPENDAEHEAYWAKCERWKNRHPAGSGNASCDSYPVWEIPLMSNTQN